MINWRNEIIGQSSICNDLQKLAYVAALQKQKNNHIPGGRFLQSFKLQPVNLPKRSWGHFLILALSDIIIDRIIVWN